MKYVYFYSAEVEHSGEYYDFGRYSFVDSDTPIAVHYSDDLCHWDDQTHSKILPPWGLRTVYPTVQDFLASPTTLTASRPSQFRKKYPELLI